MGQGVGAARGDRRVDHRGRVIERLAEDTIRTSRRRRSPGTGGVAFRSSDIMTLAATATPALLPPRLIDRAVILVALVLFAAGFVTIRGEVSAAQGVLFLVGGLLGITLYHAAFGFTGGWRAFVREGRGAGLRAQFVMLAIATAIFLPLLAVSSTEGWGLGGFVVPVSTMLVAGAFLFGIGMQLGGGCGSGTLFTVGGGSARMLVTLVFFIVGSMAGVAHAPAWSGLPSLGAISLPALFGWPLAVAAQLAVLALLYGLVAMAERRRRGQLQALGSAGAPSTLPKLLRGPWPILWGAVLLALLNAAYLLTAGHPWGITGAFSMWGAKIAAGAGLPVADWAGGVFRGQLETPVLASKVSVGDFGLILGAMLAAGLAGKFAPKVDLSPGSLAAAAVGGLLMGYGARLSSGCNIGALFGGIASGSLHGWVWFATAFVGSLAGIRGRRLFGLD